MTFEMIPTFLCSRGMSKHKISNQGLNVHLTYVQQGITKQVYYHMFVVQPAAKRPVCLSSKQPCLFLDGGKCPMQ